MTASDLSTVVETGTGVYVYGVVVADDAAAAVAEVGAAVDPAHGVASVREGEIAALVSEVSLEEFGEASLRGRLQDPAWLEAKVRAHEEVLERALVCTAIVPFRFGTIFRREDDVRRFLVDRGSEVAQVLERVRGKVEIGVKAFVDRELLERRLAETSPDVHELEGQRRTATGGREYLLRRRLERALGEEVERFRDECARASHERLAAAADDARVSELQPSELSGRAEEMLLNGAYLVHAGDDGLEAAVAELGVRYRDLGVSYDLTGPWPAYNFVPRELGET